MAAGLWPKKRPRRPFLELPRGLRFVVFEPVSILTTLLTAAALSLAIARFGTLLLTFHEGLRERMLAWTGIPTSGFAAVAVFGGAVVRSPITLVADYATLPWLLATVSIAVAAVFCAIYAYSHLSRSMMLAALFLLLVSAADSLLSPVGKGDSNFFSAFWLRCELVIWILTPWLVAMLAGIVLPTWWARLLWIMVVPAYSIVWSAVRLTFCAGLLFYAGPVLMLLLWSAFGILAELLSLCLFYSLIVYQASSLYRQRMAHG
jgi:hypothetical protein